MDENVKQEISQSEPTATPLSLEDVIAGLRGWGIEENEEILTVVASGKLHRLRISNIQTQDEMQAMLAAEELKGYLWVQKVKIEILSRAISWLDGRNLRALKPEERLITDPTDGVQKDFQVVLRNVMLTWGQELLGVLWKILMAHSDRIEKRLQNSFPDSVILTEYEKRFMAEAMKQVEEAVQEVIVDSVESILAEPDEPIVTSPPEEKKG